VDAIRDADALEETNQICAAAKEYMLAVVDDLVDAGMPVGTGTASKVAASFDEFDAQPGLGQRARSTHAGHATADDDRRFGDRCFSQGWQHCTHDSGHSLHIFLSSPMRRATVAKQGSDWLTPRHHPHMMFEIARRSERY
jgi:hypothetical protein